MGALSILIGAIGGIGGTEYRDFIRQETIRIDSSGSALAATAEFIVEDSLDSPRTIAIREQSEITIDDGATRLFGGWVKVIEDSHDGAFRSIRVRCTDYTLQLEESIVVDTFQAAGGSDRTLILAMIGAWATDIDATVAGYVDTIRAVMPEIHYADITCREALDQICKMTGGMYYVDFRKKLHYFLADEGVVFTPYLSTEPDMITCFPYTSDFVRRRDATKLVNNVRVIGNGVETWREDPASILYYDNRRFQTVIRDSNANTTEEVEYLGDWFLARYAFASYEFDATCWIPGLRAGQSIRIVNSVWGIDETYSIRKTNLRCTGAYAPVSPQYNVNLTLGYKDAPGRPDFDPDDRIPPVPPVPPKPVPPAGGWAKNVYIATKDFGVYYTSNFVADERYANGVPTWATVNTGLNLAFDCIGFRGDPYDPAGRQYYLAGDALYRRVAPGNWVSVLTLTAAATLAGGGASANNQFGANAITCNINVKGFIAVGLRALVGATYKFGWCVSTDYGASWVYKHVFSSPTSTQIFSLEVGALKGSSPYAPGTVWYCGSLQFLGIGHVYRSVDNGATWTEVTVTAVAAAEFALLVDPNDQSRVFISGYWNGASYRTAVSTNHGATFAQYDTGCTVPTGALLDSYYHISVCMDTNKTARIGANTQNPTNNKLHRTINNGTNWTDTVPQYSGDILGISLIQDAPNKLYLLRKIGASIPLPHVIFASENEGLTMINKGGANASTAGTGGGDSIPFDCGGVRGILQVWTARANTLSPSHELGSSIHTGELGYQQLAGIVGAGADMIAAGDHLLLSATHGDTLPAAVIRGDLAVGNITPKWASLPIGVAGRVLTSDGLDVSWTALPATPAHDILSLTHGDTLAAGVQQGDIIVGNATPKWSRLAKGAANTVLLSDGTNTAWGPLRVISVNDASTALAITQAGSGYGLTVMGGNVGIGTTSPIKKLQVEGDAYINGTESNTVWSGGYLWLAATYNVIRQDTSHGFNLDTYNGGFQITALTIQQGGNVGIGTTSPATRVELEQITTVIGAVADGYPAAITLDPGYTAVAAQTVTRHNYIDIQNPDGGANVTITDAAVLRFDANAGTHKAVDGASTKTTPGGVDAWVKVNINGTIHFMPAYLSKTA